MKISDIEVINVLIPLAPSDLPKPVGRNYGAYMLVKVQCDNGLEGWGEGYCGNSTTAVAALIRDLLAPEIVGQEAKNVGALYERMYRAGFYSGRIGVTTYAISALEMALWDILGKSLHAPIHALLGGPVQRKVAPHPTLRALISEAKENQVAAYASMQTFKTPEEAAVIATEAVKTGFRSVKLHQVDIESVRATRQCVGDEIEVTIDVNGFFNSVEAERFAKQSAEYQLGWLEEPIWPPDDYHAHARLRQRSPVPIAGGENEATIFGFERILKVEAFDILQPEISRLGGVLESYKVYSMAQAKNIPVSPHNFRFGPGFAATAQLSFLFPNVISMETPWFRLEADILKEGPKISNGYIRLADLPGLGMVIDENVVHKYRIKEFPRK